MAEGVDSGDILTQQRLPILDSDNVWILYARMTKIALKQIEEFLPALVNRSYKCVSQDYSKANSWRK